MSGIMINGVRMDHVRRCRCGLKPTIRTGYEGFDDGTGPFIIMCEHGVPLEDQPEDRMNFIMTRSWYKSRAVRNWNRMIREDPVTPTTPTTNNPAHAGMGDA